MDATDAAIRCTHACKSVDDDGDAVCVCHKLDGLMLSIEKMDSSMRVARIRKIIAKYKPHAPIHLN